MSRHPTYSFSTVGIRGRGYHTITSRIVKSQAKATQLSKVVKQGFMQWWQNKLELKSFYCGHGRAYLFDKVINVTAGEREDRMMMTGMHTVVNIFCVSCGSIVGWKYESAQEKGQKYKEGKFILERFKVLGPDGSTYSVSQDVYVGGSDGDDA